MKISNISLVPKTYAGQTIQPNESYIAQLSELNTLRQSETLLADIVAGDARINDIVDIAMQVAALFDEDITQRDSDGAAFVTNKACPSGWQFQKRYIEFQTCVLSSIANLKPDFSNWGDATLKFYDANNNELTTQQDIDTLCTKTIFDWEPSYDYSIIGGGVNLENSLATSDFLMWLVAAPDIPANYGGSKIMVNMMNGAIEKQVHIDGRTGKILQYDSNLHTNKLRLIVKHEAGFKKKVIVNLEHFKP